MVHAFPPTTNPPDGSFVDSLTMGEGGVLYGTTFNGSGISCPETAGGCGVVFALTPSGSTYTETVLHRFRGAGEDGAHPIGSLVLGANGTIYGTTEEGGANDTGIVYELTPSGKTYSETILYTFAAGTGFPQSGLLPDSNGNFFGTTYFGGNGNGSVYELSPAGSGYAEKDLYSFGNPPDGRFPSGIVFGPGGALYGSTSYGGTQNHGTVFALTPSQGGYVETTLASFHFYDGIGPASNLYIDKAGNIYGTTPTGGRCFGNPCRHSVGVAFKLTATQSGYGLGAAYMFKREGDGQVPDSPLVPGAGGALYGTTADSAGEATNFGALYRLQPSGQGYVETLALLFPKNLEYPSNCLIVGPGGSLFGSSQVGVYKITF
jgi:uncharacterized repeat protein (TIGR03803 family)